jgi:hypothetical protein
LRVGLLTRCMSHTSLSPLHSDPEAKSYFYQPQEEPEEEEEQSGENEEPKEPAQPADPFDQPSSGESR